MNFVPIQNARVYELVVKQIQEMIYNGELKRGDRLPPEREMRELLQISRASLREAYSALELVGLIETRPREGTFIRQDRGGSLKPLALSFLLDEHFDRDFLELRRILEVECARLAAGRCGAKDLEKLKKSIETMVEAETEAQSIEADKEFHHQLAQAAGNGLMYEILFSIAEVVERHIHKLRTDLFQDPEARARILQAHQEIFQAIVNQDPQQAADAMGLHYRYVDQAMKNKTV